MKSSRTQLRQTISEHVRGEISPYGPHTLRDDLEEYKMATLKEECRQLCYELDLDFVALKKGGHPRRKKTWVDNLLEICRKYPQHFQ